MRLNLGSSDGHISGWVNVDIAEPADQIVDLTKPWPWPDGSIDEIRAWDIIEHLPDKIHTMNEAWRVLKPNGKFDIVVPTTDGRGAFQDPQHCSFWNVNSFMYYTDRDPHRERFGAAYGITARFRVLTSRQTNEPAGIVKLAITLAAVK